MSDLPFTLDQLRILKAIAAEGSFKRAADSLYVSQPAVSLQVQNLERALAVPLFDRGGRRAQLTEAGHLLLEYGDRILSLCQETCRAIEDLQNLQGGTLIVGASQTTGTYLLPRMIGQFRQRYPDVAVQLHVHSTRRTAWAVANGQIDLAIIGGEIPPELQESLEVAPYAEDELALIMPVFHPLASNEVIARGDLYKLKFITLDSQSTIRKVIDQVLTRGGIETRRLRVEMELNSIEAIKNAVQSGLGVAFASTASIEKELQMGVIHRVKVESVEIKRMLSVIFNPNRYRSKAAEAFTREILPQFTSRELSFSKVSNKSGSKASTAKVSNAKASNAKANGVKASSSDARISATTASTNAAANSPSNGQANGQAKGQSEISNAPTAATVDADGSL
ncbi:MAG: LysR family transcriptional regulator [Cyanobacteria bacterium P01_D01_bin.105]